MITAGLGGWTLPTVVVAALMASFAIGYAARAGWTCSSPRHTASANVQGSATAAGIVASSRRSDATMTGRRATDDLLLPPATVSVDGNEVVLWTWMRHEHSHPDGLVKRVVSRFYAAAAQDPEVASYFHGVDMPVLQAHFVRAFITLADKGLTATGVASLAARHRTVRDTAGRPITPEVFDKVVFALGQAMHAEGIPAATIAQIARMCLPIKMVMTLRVDP